MREEGSSWHENAEDVYPVGTDLVIVRKWRLGGTCRTIVERGSQIYVHVMDVQTNNQLCRCVKLLTLI